MTKIKNITTAIALLVSVQFSYAQSSTMEVPVSYKLKNGMTVIFAENQGIQKVYALLSFESVNKYVADQAAVQELTNTILTQQLPLAHEALSFTDKGINLAVNTPQFEDALTAMSNYVVAPEFTEKVLDQAKAEILAHITAKDKYYPKSITKESIQSLKISDVNVYYNGMVNPATTFLTVAGNVKPAAIKSYAKNGFNHLRTTDNQTLKEYLVSN